MESTWNKQQQTETTMTYIFKMISSFNTSEIWTSCRQNLNKLNDLKVGKFNKNDN